MSEPVGDGVGGGPLSAEKVAKIRSDLDVVRSNMTVFSEMLTELNPAGGGNLADLELLQELHRTCKEMQARVGQLLCTPTTDELTVDMLQINDDMNDIFDRYDRKTAAYNKGKGLPPLANPPSGVGVGDAPLIDLGDDHQSQQGATPSLIQNLGAMNLQSQNQQQAPPTQPNSKSNDADFDQFVSSRSSTTTTTSSNPSAKKSNFDTGINQELREEQLIQGHRETDFEEMEEWLRANPGFEASLTSIPAPMENYPSSTAAASSSFFKDNNNTKPS